jgi:hypothetical protein
MAFLRFTRDKRGYEHFYLVQPTTNRRGKVRTRILYWFRTPPNVKVGREPFDEGLRRALEAQNPDVTFDWQKIVETPIPSADSEKWRERRRIERAERAARQAEADESEESTAEPLGAATEPEVPMAAGSVSPDAGTEGAGPVGDVSRPQLPRTQGGRRRRRRHGRRGQPQPIERRELSEPRGPSELLEPSEPREPGEPREPSDQ